MSAEISAVRLTVRQIRKLLLFHLSRSPRIMAGFSSLHHLLRYVRGRIARVKCIGGSHILALEIILWLVMSTLIRRTISSTSAIGKREASLCGSERVVAIIHSEYLKFKYNSALTILYSAPFPNYPLISTTLMILLNWYQYLLHCTLIH